jgi:hypothetical protein
MDTLPAPPESAPDDHVRLLAILHYVWAGLGIFGLGFLALHWSLMSSMFDPEFLARQENPPPPEMIRLFANFVWFYVAFGLWGIATMVLNVLAGRWLQTRRHRTFCMVVAGINCISIPLGTLLGVFTLAALTKADVQRTFDRGDGRPVA